MEETRSERIKRFALMHSTARTQNGKSQEFMAMEMGVSKKTIQNWEKGISSPSYFQSLEWFRILGMNPFPWFLKYTYPENLKGKTGTKSDESVDADFAALVENLPESAKRALLFIYSGDHGSSPNAVLQLVLAHLHTPLQSRITQSVITANLYEMEKELGNLICPDDVLPNMETLNGEILQGRIKIINEMQQKGRH